MAVQLIRIDLSPTHVRVTDAAKSTSDVTSLNEKLFLRPQYTLGGATSDKQRPTQHAPDVCSSERQRPIQHAGEVRKAATPANVDPVVTIQEPPPFAAPKVGGAKIVVETQQPRTEFDEGGAEERHIDADIETFPTSDGHQIEIDPATRGRCAKHIILALFTLGGREPEPIYLARVPANSPHQHDIEGCQYLSHRECFRGLFMGTRALKRNLAANIEIVGDNDFRRLRSMKGHYMLQLD